jgi:hypothetical protein
MNIREIALERSLLKRRVLSNKTYPLSLDEVLPETERIFSEVVKERKAALSIASDKRHAIYLPLEET